MKSRASITLLFVYSTSILQIVGLILVISTEIPRHRALLEIADVSETCQGCFLLIGSFLFTVSAALFVRFAYYRPAVVISLLVLAFFCQVTIYYMSLTEIVSEIVSKVVEMR